MSLHYYDSPKSSPEPDPEPVPPEEELAASEIAVSETAAIAHRILPERYRALAHEFGRPEPAGQDGSSVRTL